MNVVYVLSPDRVPLMPCTPAIARLLLKDGKAKVVRRTPFTIKLYALPEDAYMQPLTLCKTCHDGLHAGIVTLKQSGKRKGSLLHATQMNSIRHQLLQRVQAETTLSL